MVPPSSNYKINFLYILLIYVFACSPSKPEPINITCPEEVNCNDTHYEFAPGYYFDCDDLTILQKIINLNSQTYKHYLDENGNGCIEPLELGTQTWDASFTSPFGSGRLLTLELNYNEVEITNPNNPTELDVTNHRLLALPDSIGYLDSLKILSLNNNEIESLPNSMNLLSNLKKLELNNNFLTNLPLEIGNLSNLEELAISYNEIGYFPESIGNLESLKKMIAHHNVIFYLPNSIGNLDKLEWLHINDNVITSIPETFSNLTNLQSFFVDDNELTELSDELCNIDENGNTTFINSELIFSVINNKICPGEYPDCITASDIGNQACGTCPPLHWMVEGNCVFESDYLILQEFIDLNSESLIGGMRASDCYSPYWWDNFLDVETGHENSRLVEITFHHKGLYSELPESLFNLEKLRILRLHGNYLTGSIPDDITQLNDLKILKLNSNQLNGDLPNDIGSLSSLDTLWINDNQLEGTLPQSMTNLNGLIHLRLDYNNLTGTIPTNIDQLSSIKYLRLDNNDLHGEIPANIGNMENLTRLYLLNNNLSGEIPHEICNINLTSMLLHNNQLCPGETGYPECVPNDSQEQQDRTNCP